MSTVKIIHTAEGYRLEDNVRGNYFSTTSRQELRDRVKFEFLNIVPSDIIETDPHGEPVEDSKKIFHV